MEKDVLKNNRHGISVRMANAVVKGIKPCKGEPDFFNGLQGGCTVPLDMCNDACGHRERCRLRVIRNAIHNSLVEYEMCVVSAIKDGRR